MEVVVDFETRSSVELKDVGAYKYSLHPSTTILCVGYKVDDNPVKIWPCCVTPNKPNYDMYVELRDLYLNPNVKWIAHNANFEYDMWKNCLERTFPWLKCPDYDRFICTMAIGLKLGLPASLDHMAKCFNLKNSKDMINRRAMLYCSKGENKITDEKLNSLYEYCKVDVETEHELWTRQKEVLPELRNQDEYLIYLQTREINERGIPVDVELAKKVQKIIEEHEKWGKDELKLITQGEIISTGQVAAISKRLGLVDLKRNTVKEALTNPNITPSARKILELREQLGKSSIKKYKVMVEAETEGRICNCIQYYGARTGRFAGRILQPHNFAKADMEITDEIYNDIANLDYKAFTFKYPNAYKILSSALRGFIKAKEGCELYVADYAAIEARVLVWLANDQEAIEAYEKGVDTYKQMAAIIYNVTPDEVTKEQRALGKAAVLGCGYGMGKVKFKSTCEAWGIPITKELAETAVNAFRERYWKVKQFWYTVQAEAIETVELRNCTRWIGETKVKFKMDKTLQFLMARLPSGRKLFYYAPKLEQKEDDEFGNRVDLTVQTMKGNEKIREKFYGGKWAENFVQAIARDLLCHSVNQLELKNFTTILHVHDEIICEEFVRDHDEMFKEFIETMKLKPEWGKGIPIDVEGYRAKRYRK